MDRIRVRLASRLEWRLLAIFIAVALLPLAASDWLATSVIDDVGRQLTRDRERSATRAVSRQVFERLLLSGTLLHSVVEAQPPARPRLIETMTATDAPFEAISCSEADAALDADLARRWEAAGGIARGAVASKAATRLRTDARPGALPVLLLESTGAGAGRCLAAIKPGFAWAPLLESADDSSWVVVADDGQRVLEHRGSDAGASEADGGHPVERFSARLFLASEFAAANWSFEQAIPRPDIDWHGVSIRGWLLSVAASTLLLIGLAARWTIGKSLRPLDALEEGSRQLAAGHESTRVDIRRGDELGRLATSFNDMAAQLEQRIGALRALARIDAGILARETFPELACSVASRLAAVYPDGRVAVAWPDDDGKLQVVRAAPASSGAAALELASTDLRDASLAPFERLDDGLVSGAHLGEFAAQAARHGDDGPAAQYLALGVRDAGVNRALILVEATRPDLDWRQARDLRDRLAVAVMARDREQELEYRATHDALTDLRNAYGLQSSLAAMLATGAPGAALFLDLDHFKDVNDCHGHAVGDRLLQAAAGRLVEACPADAVIARNGGDEFVVVLPRSTAEQASSVAARILESLRRPYAIANNEHRCSASIGMALFPEHGTDRTELLRCADIALYESKNQGRDRATLFRRALDASLRERNALLAGLDRAVRLSEFVLHYQPRIDVATGDVVGAEALVRWQDPGRGLIFPGQFIAAAEASGLIEAIGLAVMEMAIAQVGRWGSQGRTLDRVSVNVSQHQFASGRLVPRMRELLHLHGVPGHRLEVEVTESVLGGDVDRVSQQLHEMRALGVTVAMDDFGTGYSSLSQLRTLPIDVMKIDRAFVKDLETDPNAVAIARTIVTLARALGLEIVAEGIETPAQAALLSELGCDQFQGFLYSKAVAPDEFVALMRTDAPVALP